MPRPIKRRSTKAGLPPGSLVHIGEKRADRTKITLLDYDGEHWQEKEIEAVEDCLPFKNEPTVTWINMEGIHEVDTLERLGQCFGLHPLVMEDILNTDQRPKLEDYDGYLYVVLKMLSYQDQSHEVASEQVSLVLSDNFVISFQEGISGDVFDPVRERIRTAKGHIRRMGTDYLAYSLIDAIVDNYFVVLEKLGERIELLEENLVSRPTAATLGAIHHLKREMIFLRRSVWPLREVISDLERGESPLIRESTGIYLRDVYDHTIQVIDTIETYRDTLSAILDIYLSSVSNRLNAVMKVLTIIATIFMPLTFIAGIYGMNFRYMPELEWPWGYPAVLIALAAIAGGMLLYFRRKKWL